MGTHILSDIRPGTGLRRGNGPSLLRNFVWVRCKLVIISIILTVVVTYKLSFLTICEIWKMGGERGVPL